MGLFSKFKDILFEDEEVIETEKPVKEEKKEKRIEKKIEAEIPRREEVKVEQPVIKEEVKKEVKKEIPETRNIDNTLSDRDVFKSEKTFPFPDFDEEEFTSVSRSRDKSTNVLEYERKKKVEKRTDFGRYEKTEIKETVEKKKFRPSPIISPVYGILNEDYTINDIKQRNVDNSQVDVDWVRKKAFEPQPRVQETAKVDEKPGATYYEESVTVKVSEPEEKRQKVKTIDDLLEDTSDVVIDTTPSREVKNSIQYDDVDDDFEINEVSNRSEEKEDDTLENDLFDLIDSMYENREDGDD